MTPDLERLNELYKRSTPGPWTVWDDIASALAAVRRDALEEAAKVCDEMAASYDARADELHAQGPITYEAEVDRWRCRAGQARRDADRILSLRDAALESGEEGNG